MPEVQPRESKAFEAALKAIRKSTSETRLKLLKAKAHKVAMEIEKRPGMYICSK